MAIPAVQNDRMIGQCRPQSHLVPNPAAPPPSILNPQPLPFSAPLQRALISTVTIGGKPVAVKGSSGPNSPLHVGLFPSDKAQVNPALQVGEVTRGSATVTFGGQPAATSESGCKTCGGTARIATTVTNVTVG